MALHIVFVNPEIPPNTGNIARTCAATDTVLHLVKPLGFNIDDKSVKRAGLDYWQYVNLEVHESLEDFMDKYGEDGILKLWNEVYSWIESPKKFFRDYSVDYFEMVMEGENNE